MTKMMADGMLEMARYSGSAGAQFMWADLEGLLMLTGLTWTCWT